MYSKKYSLRYLPLFYEDLDEKVSYISEKLKNPKAASDLLDKVEKAILERLPIAESFEPYHSIRERRYSYYRIYVGNYTIYYVVIDDDKENPIMEVRRFLYNRQNQHRLV
jgi:Plasmid stabilisation system protein.